MPESAMTPDELRQALRIKRSTFYKHQALGRFEQWELKPRIVGHRYSRKAVQAYLDRDQAPASGREPVPARGPVSTRGRVAAAMSRAIG